ncbi:MAG TPA: CBS domain-containing protein [Beijerinckiaceae bacterium]|jgi:CBS domain-containing protein
MQIAEVMTRDVRVIAPERTIRDAARLMDELNVGVIPVCEGDRLVGLVTDRDITVRATAAGLAPDAVRVREVMTSELRWCHEDDDAGEVLRHMSEAQIRRMPVVDQERRLIGIVSLGDLSADRADGAEEALRRISTPSEPDRSGTPSTRRAGAGREARPDPLTADERRELARRRDRSGEDRFGGELRAGLNEGSDRDGRQGRRGPSSNERSLVGRLDGNRDRTRADFRFREEDALRAAFPGGYHEAYGEGQDQGGGPMQGGFGGDGYRHYGQGSGFRAQGAGGPAADPFADHGSHPDGTPRNYGSEGEENYDRGYLSARPFGDRGDRPEFGRGASGGRDYGAGPGHVVFGHGDDRGHAGRGPKGYKRTDDRIREDVSDRLFDDAGLDASDIDVSVADGEVTLAGTVRRREDRRRAEDIAHEVRGVGHVQNNLRVGAAGQGGSQAASPNSGSEPDATPGDTGATDGTASVIAGSPSGGRTTGSSG